MRLIAGVFAGVVAGALVTALLVGMLGDDDEARSEPGRQVVPLVCGDVISDSAIEAFGWRPSPAAAERVGRCERNGSDGLVSVGDRAVAAPASDRADEARSVYDAMCATLFRSGAKTPDREVAWLPSGTTACVRTLPPEEQMGLAEMFLLTADDEVVQIRVAALVPTAPEALQDGMIRLVDAAETVW